METTAPPPTHILSSTRFGTVSYQSTEIIDFPIGLPGFADLRRFLPIALDDQKPFLWLQAVDQPAVALPVIDPWQLFPEYDPRLPVAAIEGLSIVNPDDFVVLVVAVVEPGGEHVSVNLLAPIIINVKRGEGRQVALDDRRYSVRTMVERVAVAAPVAGGSEVQPAV